MNESQHDTFTEVLLMYVAELLPELISFFLLLISAIFILRGSINLFKKYKAPGVSFIFYSATGTLFSFIIYLTYIIIFNEEENQLFEKITTVLFSALFVLGAYGFLQLCKHLINEK